MQALLNGVVFLTQLIFDIYVIFLLVRIMVQWHAYRTPNAIVKFVATVTNPVVNPLQSVIPRIRNIDLPAIVVMCLVVLIKITILTSLLSGRLFLDVDVLFLTGRDLCEQIINFFFFSIIIYVILGWINQYNSALYEVVAMMANSLLKPVRTLVPPLAGFDISPLIVLVGLKLVSIVFITPFFNYLMVVT
jgi:YggT family protein